MPNDLLSARNWWLAEFSNSVLTWW